MSFSPKFLQKVVDLLLPGLPVDDRFGAIPSASQVGVDSQLAHHLGTHPDATLFGELLTAIVAQSGGEPEFVTASEATAIEVLQAVETAHPDSFAKLLFVVSADYYEAATVLQAFGWPSEPPQPQGYPLDPLREALLDPVKQRGEIWREV